MKKLLRKDFTNAMLRFKSMMEKFFIKSENSFGELLLLRKIESGINAAGMCSALHISKPAVSYMLNSLEKKGCIIREISPSDRRKIDVTLTDKGRELAAVSEAYYEKMFGNVEEKFGEENLKEFIRLIHLLSDIITDEVKGGNENV